MVFLHYLDVAIVLAWVLLDAGALGFALYSARAARQDRAWLRQAGLNGARSLVAGQNVRNALIRAFLFLSLLSVGLVALPADLLAPIPPRLPDGWLGPFLVNLTFVLASGATMVGAILDHRDRQRLIDQLRDDAGEADAPAIAG